METWYYAFHDKASLCKVLIIKLSHTKVIHLYGSLRGNFTHKKRETRNIEIRLDIQRMK